MGSLASCLLILLLLLVAPISAKNNPPAPRNCGGDSTTSRKGRAKAPAPAVLDVPSANDSSSVTMKNDYSPVSAPVESDSAGSSSSSGSGSSSSSGSGDQTKPPLLKGPLPPLPKPGDHPHPIPPKPKNDPAARSSSSSSTSSTPVRASSPEVLIATPSESPSSSSRFEQISPAQTQTLNSGVTNAEVPAPAPAVTIVPAPAPRQASHTLKIPAKVLIRGQVMCRRCKTRRRSRGISGVTVQLTCSAVVLTTVTDHHGKFKIDFRHTVPMGFSSSCTVTVQNSTLPSSCNVPDSSESRHALIQYSSHHSLHYYVHPFNYIGASSGRH